jgi:hypothetical protein
MSTTIRVLAILVSTLIVGLTLDPAAAASPSGGKTITICYPDGTCVTKVVDPGGGGSGRGQGGSGGGSGDCSWKGKAIPCVTNSGHFNANDGCYYREANPYPTSGPVYESYKTGGGGIYWADCFLSSGSGGYVWLPSPPPGLGPTPAMLARQAFDKLTMTKPSTGRYPNGTLKNGEPYTVVHAATWYWTDPADFQSLTARAAAGAVWAEVTVKPTALTFTPGDGNSAVSCAGPGTTWNSAYGVWDPSPSGCDYHYPNSSIHEPHGVVTATYGIRWQVTWVGSGNTSGTLPDQTTTSRSTFAVAEVESVVTR